MATSAPASSSFTTASASWTPVVAASDASMRPVQDRHPPQYESHLGRRAQDEVGRRGERLEIDVGLVEAVEQHQSVGAGVDEATGHVTGAS